MFCRKFGEEVKEIGNFCGKCGEKQQQKQSLRKKKLKRYLQILINILREKNEQVILLKPSKSSTSTSTITRKSEPLMHNVTINVGIMKNVNLNLKPVRGKK